MGNRIIIKSGDRILIEARRNVVELETENDYAFMTPEQALELASALVSAANEANNQLGSAQA